MTTDIFIVFVAVVVFALGAVCATAVIVHRERAGGAVAYDVGGRLAPGTTNVYNGTGKPETVNLRGYTGPVPPVTPRGPDGRPLPRS